MRVVVALIAVFLLASACADEPVAPTPATVPVPTATLQSSPTPPPTATPAPTTPTPAPTATPKPTSTPAPTPTFAPTPVILPTVEVVFETPTPTAAFPQDLDRKLDAISLQAAAIRGLTNRGSFERRLVSSEELRQMLEEDLAEDAEDLEIADRLYSILGIIEPDSSLSDILLDVYSNIVVGLFDTDENALFVLADGDEFTLSNELTVAHEVAHGLQQQYYNIRDIRDGTEDNSDRRRAITALIEGDASLVEIIYRLRVFDDRQRQMHMEESQAADLSAYRAAPALIQRTVAFPYFEGANFAIGMYQLNGDFAAIDQAYDALPESTEQILHPELYGVDSPLEITMPDLTTILGDGWSEVDRDVMGELFLAALLQAILPTGEANQAAAGWGGDSYILLEDDMGSEALVSVSVWDTLEDAEAFSSALMQYFQVVTEAKQWEEQEVGDGASAHRISSGSTAVEVRSESGQVSLTVAVDLDTVDDIVTALMESEGVTVDLESAATSTSQ